MSRKIIVVLGKTGHGKSEWTKRFVASLPSLYIYDPLASYSNVTWCDHEMLLRLHDAQQLKRARVGVFDSTDAELLGCLAFVHGDTTIVIEECSTVFTKGNALPRWAGDLVFMGRHRNASMIVTAQRAASIPIEIRSQAHRIVSFAQHEGDDLKWLKGFFGNRINELPFLPECVCLDSEGGEISKYRLTFDNSNLEDSNISNSPENTGERDPST